MSHPPPRLEPFPPMSTSRHIVMSTSEVPNVNNTATGTSVGAGRAQERKRRKSSNSLPGEPRGDTGVAALSTIDDQKRALELNGPPVSPTSPPPTSRSHKTRGHKRRKAKSLLRRYKHISLKHTWLNPLLVILLTLTLYAFNPSESNPLHKGLFLSYPVPPRFPPLVNPNDVNPPSIEYGKGGHDFTFIAFYTVVFSFTREFLMQRLIRPIAIYCGIKQRGKQSRFMEQAYTALYFLVFGPFGIYVMYRSPVWFFNTTGMYAGFPHRQHEGAFKAYYLLQAAYWTQQAIVLCLQLEKPRKDFKELVAHHVITIALIWCSYRFHFAFMGVAVFVTHDVSDFFLATSKILNYLDSPLTTPYFAVFMFVWAYARHYTNLRILYSILTTFRTVGPFELNWDTQQYKCWISQYITFGLLGSLQAVNVFWFFLILRIAKRMVIDDVAEDERSVEDEEEEEGSTEEKKEKMRKLGVALPNGESGTMNGVVSNGDDNDKAAPQVLLNGVPVENAAASNGFTTSYSSSSSSSSSTKTPNGVRSVEVQSSTQQRQQRKMN